VSARFLKLSGRLADAILTAAARAYPDECCGLIEGIDRENGWEAVEVHESRNVSGEPRRRFLVDPQTQFDLMRALRGSERRVIGCFHSHPGGRAEPSADDRASAFESNFLYLIAAGTKAAGFELKAYVFEEEAKDFSKIALVP
jgi:desampylase